MTIIDVNALKAAVRARLIGDVALGAALETVGGEPGVFSPGFPSTVQWTGVSLEYGIQAMVLDDDANAYSQDGRDITVRVMAHKRSTEPGVGSYTDLYTALRLANTALTATPLAVSDQTLWYLRWVSGIPEEAPEDPEGFRQLQVGDLYRLRAY